MLFNVNVKSVVLLLFFCHALFFSVLLFSKSIQEENKADRWLSVFLLLTALYIAPFMLGYAGWYSGGIYREILFYVPFQQLFLMPPVLHGYVRSLLHKEYRFRKRDYLHFVPAVLYAVYSLIVFVVDKIVLTEVYFYEDGRDKDFAPWYQVAGFILLVIYLIICLYMYKKYRKKAFDTLSFAESVIYKWMERFILAFLTLLAIRLLYFIINPEWAEFGRKFWYYLTFSILVYYISIQGIISSLKLAIPFTTSAGSLSKGNAPPHKSTIHGIGSRHNPLLVAEAPENFDELPEQTVAGQPLKEDMADLLQWKKKIEDLLEKEKIYEDPLLTIADMAGRLKAPAKKISQAINQGFAMNFNDLVNYYRVQAVARKIEAGEENLHTVLALAFDCGFNSKSTFNRAFKKHTGRTPKELIRQKQGK